MSAPRLLSPLRRMFWRDLWQIKPAAATIVFILAVGVASLEGFLGTWRDLKDARDRYYRDYDFADAELILRRAPRGLLGELAAAPGVDRLEARVRWDIPFELPGVDRRLSARLHSLPEVGPPGLNRLRLIAGRLPAPGGLPEVVLAADFARAREVGPGARLRLVTDQGGRWVRVVGVATSPEYVFIMPPGGGAAPAPKSFAVLWGRRDFVEGLTEMRGAFNSLLVRAGRGSDPAALARRLERALTPHGVLFAAPRPDMPSHAVLRDELTNLRNQARFMPTLFLLAAALVMNLVLSRLVASQRVSIGTLKALGLSSRAVLTHYLGYAAVLGAAGGLLGALGGRQLSGLLAGVYAKFYYLPAADPAWHLDLAGLGFAIAWVAGGLGVLRAALDALRLSPAEAMRPAPPASLAGAAALKLGRLPLLWRIALRGLMRHPFRAGVSALGVGLGAGLLISSRFFTDAMTKLTDFRFRVIQRYDLQVRLRDGVGVGAAEELARLPGVTQAEVEYGQLFELARGRRSRKVFVHGIDPGAAMYRPRDASGAALPLPREGLLIAEKLAELLDAPPGSRVRLTHLRSRRKLEAAVVAGTFPSYLGLDAFADRRWLSRAAGDPSSVQVVQVKGAGLDAAAVRRLSRRPGVLRVTRRADRVAGFEGSVKGVLDAVAAIMIVLAGALACGMNLAGALVTLAERRRELAVLRVQGFAAAEVSDVLLHEHAWVGFAGLAVGFPLGHLFAGWCHRGFDTELYRLPWVLGRPNLAQALMYSLLFSAAAHLVVRRWVRAQPWREDLAVKE